MRRSCRGGRVGRNTLGPAGDTPAATAAFTIVEVIVVMAIILVLAGLILGTSGYVHNKAARSRAQAEIQALSAALESYKADNGIYPDDTTLDARLDTDSANYAPASLALYKAISGDADNDSDRTAEMKSYMSLKPNQLSPVPVNPTTQQPQKVNAIIDPFGNSYGYSTANQTTPAKGYNPTFDLWSTAGSTTSAGQTGWIKNW